MPTESKQKFVFKKIWAVFFFERGGWWHIIKSFARVLEKPQKNGSSEERQWNIEKHRKRAAELGATFLEVPYIDRGKSGFHGDNLAAALGRIKTDIQSGVIPKGDILSVESHSRLGRLTPGEAVMQYLGFLRDGIRLDIKGVLRSWQSINGEQGLPTLMNDFIEIFTAHQESLNKSKYARDTNQIKRDKLSAGTKKGVMKTGTAGWFVGKRCPAWLEPLGEPDENGYLYRIIDSVARIIRQIFDWREQGIGCYVIAQRLNAMDDAEPLRNRHIIDPGKKIKAGWSQSMVARVLRNEAVIGRYHPAVMQTVADENGEPIRGKRIAVKVGDDPVEKYYPPVIQPGQFQRVRGLVEKADKSGNKGHRGRTGKQFGNIVHGIVLCDCCGGPVNLWSRIPKAGKGKPTRELKCEHARRKFIFWEGHRLAGQRCPNRRGFPYSVFEAALFSLFSPAMIPVLAEMLPQRHRDDLVTRRLADIDATIAEDEQGIKRLARLVAKADDDETADAYDAEIKLIRADLNRLRVERDRIYQQGTAHDENHEQQMAVVIANLNTTSDDKAQYDARARLNQLLANQIGVTLHEDRTVVVRINAHSGLNPVDARLTLNGLESIAVIDRDGSILTHYDRVGLMLLEPLKASCPEQIRAAAAA